MPDAVDLAPLDEVLDHLPERTSDVIPVLQRTQEIYGFLPPAALQRISERMNIALGKIYGVATFYAQFYLEKRGRHVLKVCDGTACHVKGAPSLLTAVTDEYHIHADETTVDGELTLEIVYCMGSCALAPVAVVDGQVTGRVVREKLLRQVRRQVADQAGAK